MDYFANSLLTKYKVRSSILQLLLIFLPSFFFPPENVLTHFQTPYNTTQHKMTIIYLHTTQTTQRVIINNVISVRQFKVECLLEISTC